MFDGLLEMDCGIKFMLPIFKIEMFIYQSKAKLDMIILFGNFTHHLDPEIRKMLGRVLGCQSDRFVLIKSFFLR